jgi:hypothetical protein
MKKGRNSCLFSLFFFTFSFVPYLNTSRKGAKARRTQRNILFEISVVSVLLPFHT